MIKSNPALRERPQRRRKAQRASWQKSTSRGRVRTHQESGKKRNSKRGNGGKGGARQEARGIGDKAARQDERKQSQTQRIRPAFPLLLWSSARLERVATVLAQSALPLTSVIWSSITISLIASPMPGFVSAASRCSSLRTPWPMSP